MIELRDATQVRSFWFMERLDQNWMGCVLRQEGEPWKFVYRFRHFLDDKIHDSADTRSWTAVVPSADHADDTGDALVTTAEYVAQGLIDRGFSDKLWVIRVDGLGPEAMERLASAEWAHCRTESHAAVS